MRFSSATISPLRYWDGGGRGGRRRDALGGLPDIVTVLEGIINRDGYLGPARREGRDPCVALVPDYGRSATQARVNDTPKP